MTSTLSSAARPARRALAWRRWRTGISVAAVAPGAAVVIGCLLPWATAFEGLMTIPGIRGGNGKVLAAAGVLIAAAGIWHLIRGSAVSRYLMGVVGVTVVGFAAFLLMQLSSSLRALGGNSMVLLQGGPGLWVVLGGGGVAFATLFLPASGPVAESDRQPRADGAALAAWAADRESAGPRRWLQLTLGIVWILDAALQFQPYMFSRGFVTQIIEPAGMGSPAIVSHSIMGTSQLLLAHVAVFNAAFATIQLALGAGLLWRRTTRAALAGTIVWALAVWWLGEGLGGILTGSATPVTGAPGAALLYAVIAVLAWPARAGNGAPSAGTAPSIAAGSPVGLLAARLAWVVLWVGSAYLVLQAPNRAPGALHTMIAGMATGEPGWIGALDRGAASAIGSGGLVISIVLAVLFAVIAAGIFDPAALRPVLILSAVTALTIWVVGQDFGGMLTGHGTDPNSGLLLVVLAAAFWPFSRARRADRAPSAVPATSVGAR